MSDVVPPAVPSPSAPDDAVVRLSDVSVVYGKNYALRGVSALFSKGAVGLLGPNGAGKSTMLKALLGFIAPSKGRLTVLGLDVATRELEIRARIGYMSHANLPQGVANQIPAIRWFSASGHVNGGLNGSLRAETRDEQAGQNLRDVVNGFLALARMQAGAKPEVTALVNSLQVSGTGKNVSISFSIPAEMINAIGAAAEAAHNQDKDWDKGDKADKDKGDKDDK